MRKGIENERPENYQDEVIWELPVKRGSVVENYTAELSKNLPSLKNSGWELSHLFYQSLLSII